MEHKGNGIEKTTTTKESEVANVIMSMANNSNASSSSKNGIQDDNARIMEANGILMDNIQLMVTLKNNLINDNGDKIKSLIELENEIKTAVKKLDDINNMIKLKMDHSLAFNAKTLNDNEEENGLLSNKRMKMSTGKVTVVAGAMWGDEGKGKKVDELAQTFDIVARCAGGENAGHTVVVDGITHKFHLLPSGILSPQVVCVIGNGVVVNLNKLFDEIDELKQKGGPAFDNVEERIKISERAHVVFQMHKIADCKRESERTNSGSTAIGTTKKGIGPAYAAKMGRIGIRVIDVISNWDRFLKLYGDELHAEHQRFAHVGGIKYDDDKELDYIKSVLPRLTPMVIDTAHYINKARICGNNVLVELANAAFLDIDFGTYPYVTSSSCIVGGACTGLGIPPTAIGRVIGITKAYLTRVGEGPFPTKLTDADGLHLQVVGKEIGTSTGRSRDCGWLDIPMLKYSNMLNDYSEYNITKLDVLTGLKKIKVGVNYVLDGKNLESMPADLDVLSKVTVEYEEFDGWTEDITKVTRFEDLPVNAKKYINRLQQLLVVPITEIGVGPDRINTIRVAPL